MVSRSISPIKRINKEINNELFNAHLKIILPCRKVREKKKTEFWQTFRQFCKMALLEETIKEIRTPGIRFREFLALNAEDEVQLFQFENEILSDMDFLNFGHFFFNPTVICKPLYSLGIAGSVPIFFAS